MPFCIECGTENPAQARFCLACGTPLASAPAPTPPSEERKIITAIFVDLVGSTARSEQIDPEDVKSLVAPYHARVRAELERHGGTFEKFSGDAILALFGSPMAHEDDPERCIRAGFAVRRAIAELNAEDQWLDLHIRIGIHTGEALVMLGARPSEGEWSAAGDVLNTAARIQSAAPIDGILVGHATYVATENAFEFRQAEPVQAKGKSEPVTSGRSLRRATARLGDRRTQRRWSDGRRSSPNSRASATSCWARVVPASPPSSGRPASVRAGCCTSSSDNSKDAVTSTGDSASRTERASPTGRLRRSSSRRRASSRATTARRLRRGSTTFLESLPSDDRDELRTIASALSNLIGIPTTPRGTYTTSEISQTELHWGIRRALQLLAAEQPTAMIIEDLHWAEPTLLELISYIATDDVDAPLALICSARSELAEVAPGFLRSEGLRRTVELHTLGADEAAAMLGELAGDPALAATPFASALIANAGGNPLFLEETVRMLRDRGSSTSSGGATRQASCRFQRMSRA